MYYLSAHRRAPTYHPRPQAPRAAMWRKTLLPLLATTVLLILSGCNADSDSTPATEHSAGTAATAANPSLAVEVTQPQTAVWPKTIPASGDIAAWELASAGPESMGLTIRRVLVREGDYVQKNQVLATFSNAAIRAQSAQAQAGLAEAQAAAADAKANAIRMKKLVDSGFMSAVQYNQYQTAAETAQARVAAAQAVVRQQRVRLNNTTLRAPVAGIVAHSSAVAGALTAAGQSLFTIIRDGRLEWRAQVTAEQLAQITPGMKATVTLPGNITTTATVRTSSPAVDTRTRNATIYADLPVESPARMGMFASGLFSGEPSSVITLPQTAIVFRDGFSHVVQVQKDSTVRVVRISTGGQQGSAVAVSGGIHADGRYVLRGGAFLNNGDTVRIIDSSRQQEDEESKTAATPASSD